VRWIHLEPGEETAAVSRIQDCYLAEPKKEQ
jgi:hypothetical protein